MSLSPMIRADVDAHQVTVHMVGAPSVVIERPAAVTLDEWNAFWGKRYHNLPAGMNKKFTHEDARRGYEEYRRGEHA